MNYWFVLKRLKKSRSLQLHLWKNRWLSTVCVPCKTLISMLPSLWWSNWRTWHNKWRIKKQTSTLLFFPRCRKESIDLWNISGLMCFPCWGTGNMRKLSILSPRLTGPSTGIQSLPLDPSSPRVFLRFSQHLAFQYTAPPPLITLPRIWSVSLRLQAILVVVAVGMLVWVEGLALTFVSRVAVVGITNAIAHLSFLPWALLDGALSTEWQEETIVPAKIMENN